MCSLVPSVTLWGTSQVSIPTTVVQTSISISTPEPVVTQGLTTIISNCIGTTCFRTETQAILVTITQAPVTSSVVSTLTTTKVVTRIVPAQTLYYPCSSSEAVSTGLGSTFQISAPTFSVTPTTSASVTSPSQILSLSISEAIFTLSSSSTPSISVTSEPPTTPSATFTIPGPLGTTTTSSSRTGATVPTTTPALASDSTTSNSHATSIAGGIIGGIVGLTLLVCLGFWLQRLRETSDVATEDADYWERRFRELESNDEKGQKHLTLDLRSKQLPNRPASRLSTISSYFKKPLPQPSQVRSDNFSRPLPRSPSFSQRVSTKWLPKLSIAGAPPTPNWETDMGEERKKTEWFRPRSARSIASSLAGPVETMSSPIELPPMPDRPPEICIPKTSPRLSSSSHSSGDSTFEKKRPDLSLVELRNDVSTETHRMTPELTAIITRFSSFNSNMSSGSEMLDTRGR